MDIFKRNRYLNLVIILLVVLNFATLTMLWLGRPQHPAPPAKLHRPEQERAQIGNTLRDELAFDDVQIKEYLRLRQNLRERVRRLDDEIRQIKRQMFDKVLQEHPQHALSDSLLTLAQEKQAQIEKSTYQHFLDLRELCTPEQQARLKRLMFELFHGPPNSAPKDRHRPPPPENQ